MEVLDTVAPAVLINATSGGADWAVTAEGGIGLAQASAGRIRLVLVSSDAVFSGTGHDWYDESCLPDPLTPYGAAKAAAETAVRLLCPDAAVARTSLIMGRSGHEQLVHALAAGPWQGALFTDDIRCPVHVEDPAAALWEITRSDTVGIFHLADPKLVDREAGGNGDGMEGEVMVGSDGAQEADPVKDGRGDRESVLREHEPGAADTGAERGQGAAGVARRHQSGQVSRLDELDAVDLTRCGTDRRDLVLLPDAAVEDVQELAGESHDGGRCAAGEGYPVDSQPAGDGRHDAELLLLAGSALRGGLVLVDGATGQQTVGTVGHALEQDLTALAGDQHGGASPRAGEGPPGLRPDSPSA